MKEFEIGEKVRLEGLVKDSDGIVVDWNDVGRIVEERDNGMIRIESITQRNKAYWYHEEQLLKYSKLEEKMRQLDG
jgi:hypothetical protein